MTTDNIDILAIETSCDETACSIVRNGSEVLCNVIATQYELHEKFGGVVPEIASRAQLERILPVVDSACEEAGVALQDIAAVAVSNRPGLIGSLIVGVAAAKGLAWSLGKPLIGIDHIRAHLYAGMLDKTPVEYPALGLVISGGHSSMYEMSGPLEMQLLGQTIDDAIGEAYDKVAKILGLGFPGGPILDKMAQKGNAKNAPRFPRSLLAKDSLDFSYSGLKTSLLYHICGKPQGRGKDMTFAKSESDWTDEQKADIAAAFQEAAVDVLIKKLDRAYQQFQAEGKTIKSLLIGGGVSANSLVRSSMVEFGEKYDLDVRLPKMGYCLDNAAMIGGLAYHRYINGESDALDLETVATTSID